MSPGTSQRYARTLALGVALLCGHALVEPAGAVEPGGDADGYRIETDTPQRLILQVTTRYRLGDNDTRTDARRLALQAAKVMAAERAGTYIESQTTVGGNQIKSEEIKTLSAAYIAVTVLGETAEVGPQGDLQLVLTIRADLDKTLLQQRIDSLLQNTEFRTQIAALEAQNRSLNADLARMNTRLASSGPAARGTSGDPRHALLKERDDVLTKIDGTNNAVKLVFERGTLYALAQASAMAQQASQAKIDLEIDLAQRDIDDILRKLVEDTRVTVGEPKVNMNRDGTADVRIKLSWTTSSTANTMLDGLRRYFFMEKNKYSDSVIVKKYNNPNGQHPHCQELFQHLVEKRVIVEVSLGGHSKRVSLGHFTGENWLELSYDYHGKYNTSSLILPRVPVSALQQITSIDARVFLQ